jgi:hypothetical protein
MFHVEHFIENAGMIVLDRQKPFVPRGTFLASGASRCFDETLLCLCKARTIPQPSFPESIK